MADADGPKDRWSRLPAAWIVRGGLNEFIAGSKLGESMAALKILVAIHLLAKNARVDADDPDQGSVMIAYDDLMTLTNLSRALVSTGIKRLQALGRVTVKRGKRGEPSRYRLPDYAAEDHWTKISNRRLFRGTNSERIGVLHDLSPRRTCDLDALKLYLLFSAMQDKAGGGAMLGYEKIIEYSGVPQNRIRRAVSVLVEHGLITVGKGPDPEIKTHNPPNRYRLLGIGNTVAPET